MGSSYEDIKSRFLAPLIRQTTIILPILQWGIGLAFLALGITVLALSLTNIISQHFLGGVYLFLGIWFFGTYYGLNRFVFKPQLEKIQTIFETSVPLLYWSKDEYDDHTWDQYAEEEYGYESGRQYSRVGLCCIKGLPITLGLTVAAVFCGALVGGTIESAVGPKRIGVVGYIFFILGLGLVVAVLVGVAEFCRRKFTKLTWDKYDFVLLPEGFGWPALLHFWAMPPPGGKWEDMYLNSAVLEDIRINEYNGMKIPCIEICVTYRGKPTFSRIPIPSHKMNLVMEVVRKGKEWQNLLEFSQKNTSIWEMQTDIALEMETSLVV